MSQLDGTSTSDQEQLVDVIGCFTRASGFMDVKQKQYTLVATDRRLIFAELTKERSKQLLEEANAQAQLEGKGLLGRASARMHARDGVAESYRSMSPEQVLRETPTNFAIDRSDIKKVKFKTGYGDTADDYALIKTSKGTYKLLGLQAAHKKRFAAAGFTR